MRSSFKVGFGIEVGFRHDMSSKHHHSIKLEVKKRSITLTLDESSEKCEIEFVFWVFILLFFRVFGFGRRSHFFTKI